MAHFTAEAGAALAFGILYFLLCLWMYAGYFTGRFKLRSRWTLLTFHATIRVASQVGVVPHGGGRGRGRTSCAVQEGSRGPLPHGRLVS